MSTDRKRMWTIRLLVMVPIGLIVGGTIQNAARQFLPAGAAKEFLTVGLTWQSAPQPLVIPFLIMGGSVSLGPAALDVSLLGAAAAVATVGFLIRMFE